MKKTYLLGLALLSATSALAQADLPDFQPPRRKAAVSRPGPTPGFRPNPQSRISGELQQLYQRSRQVGSATQLQREFVDLSVSAPQAGAAQRGAAASAPAVLVRVTAQDVNALLPQLTARGFRVVSSYPQLHFVEGYLPLTQLAPEQAGVSALAQRGLLGVLAVMRPDNEVGKVQSQADFLLGANRVRGARPTSYTGQGLRIGTLSDSYNALGGAGADVASGDLPPNVQVLDDIEGGTDEGRAMMQLIYDIAPGATQAFATANRGEGSFADNIRALADPARGNCRIIVDDVSYFAEPFFQDGVIAQAVNEVTTQRGVAYYSSAGNRANQSSEYLTPTFLPTANGSADLNFAPASSPSDTRQRFRIPKGSTLKIVLQWSDPFYTTAGVQTDLDAYFLAANGDTVARANDNNRTSQTPVEILRFTNPSSATNELFDLVIARRSGTATPARVKYMLLDAILPQEYFVGGGTVYGHSASTNSTSVAATPSYNRLVPETFTSLGSPTILFAPNGTPLPAPVTRPKPDLAAVDGVSTTFFAGGALPDPQDGYLFFGTSAAAPNAAAVAALLWQAEPSLSPLQLRTRLQNTARDLGAPGFDNVTGAGLINAYDAIFGPPTPLAPPLTETFDAPPSLARGWELTDRGAARSLVRSDFAPASAAGQLIQDGFFPYYTIGTGTSEATLHLNLTAAPAGGWTLTFRHKKFANEDDQQMPTTFAGSSNTDGVALSVDGLTWYRLLDLTGSTSTTAYQTATVDLSAFALANGLTLGPDVRIRFQRSGRTRVDAATPAQQGGRAFDDVTVTGPLAAQQPVALFAASASPASPICPGSSVQFTDASLFGPVTGYSWSFPGGTPATSTAASPSVTYPTAGRYDVTLIVTTAGGTALRTVPGAIVVSNEVPQAAFAFRPSTPLCPGATVAFTNQTTGTRCATTYAWTFAGGSPATSTSPTPTVSFATAGTYAVTLTATNANGSTSQTQNVVIQAGAALPYAETFASGLPAPWTVLNPDKGITWAYTPSVVRKDGTPGPALSLLFGPYEAAGQRDSLQSPLLDLRGQARATLRFDLAYAPITPAADGNDSLAVDVFAACTNQRLGRAYLKSALTGLGTVTPRNAYFTPSAAGEWRQENVDLTAYVSQQVYLRFVAFNQFGNNLFLTNVRVDTAPLLSTGRAQANAAALQVFPNPVVSGGTLTLQLPAVAGLATVRVLDAVGRTSVQQQWLLSGTGSVQRTLAMPLAAGLYTVLCQTADGQLFARRVEVQ
ncbi:PKD domain-containing protein [Hymenobacter sp. BT664]|uniref:PKD domain-containing protein n=1 Tax=Hymenobacter montanus TaxID=2771359 RepID=A0A927BHN0_9BACT|nr:PKD domain-containing protein [Hymenobacter montanus]MBD2770177.1 PKD domain-containing protein [Hymenobacter montanus]